MKLSREVKTGILALGAILLFIFGYNYLKGSNLLESNKVFYVTYDNVEGLSASAPVTINGLQVGKVQSIDFADTSGHLVVSFTVESDFKFSKESIVQIYSSGFIGGNNLGIIPTYDANNIAVSGDTLQGVIQQGILDKVTGQLEPLEKKIESTLTSLDTLLIGFNEILDEEGKKNLQQTLGNLNASVASFRNLSGNMNSLLVDNKEKLNSTISNLDTTSKNFAQLSDSLAQIELGATIAQLQGVVDNFNGITQKIENGEGSVGKLLKDEELYDNLAGAAGQLEQLLEDMKLNPKRYVHFSLFGRRAKPYEKQPDSISQ